MTVARARRWLIVLFAVVWVLTSAGLAAAGGRRWWTYVALEGSPMTWAQSVVLLLAAAGAVLLALAARARLDGPALVTWAALAAGFVYLGLDERFALHERLRDRVLAPADVRLPFLPWMAPGDIVLLVVGILGLAFLPRVLRGLRRDVGATRALLIGVGLSVIAVLADSVDPARWGVAGERLEQTLEEVLELAAGLSLLAATALPLVTLVVTASLSSDDQPVGPSAFQAGAQIGGRS